MHIFILLDTHITWNRQILNFTEIYDCEPQPLPKTRTQRAALSIFSVLYCVMFVKILTRL